MNTKHLSLMLVLAVVATTVGCQTTPVQNGAIQGSVLGGALGAVIGNNSHGRTGEGALIGAGAGALAGALIGDHTQKGGGTARHPVATAPAPVVAPPPPTSDPVVYGHYETRVVRTPSGE